MYLYFQKKEKPLTATLQICLGRRGYNLSW